MYTGIIKTIVTSGMAALLVMVSALAVHSEPLSVTMPDTLLKAGDEEWLAIDIDDITENHEIYSGEFSLEYNESVISIDNIQTDNTVLSEVGDVMYNATTGVIAFASSATVEGSGPLVYLQVRMTDDAGPGDATGLTMEATFNEGEPEASVTSGNISVPQISISPSSVVMMEGETVQFEVSGDIFEPVEWSVSNAEVAEISTDGELHGKEPGNIRVFAEDAIGSRDSTDVFRINSDALAELTVSAPDTSVRQTREFWWPVEVSDVTGLDVSSVQFEASWSVNHLELLELDFDGTLLEDFGTGNVEYETEPGELNLAAAGESALEGSGALVNIKLRVQEEASGNRSLSFSNVLFNEDLEPDLDIGEFEILDAPEILLSDDHIDLVAGESATIEVEEGGTSPYEWKSADESIAEIDEATGQITALSRGITQVYAVDAEGFESERTEVEVYDVNIHADVDTLVAPEPVTIPVLTEDITGLDIYAFEAAIAIDTTLISFEGILSDGSISDDMSFSSNVSDGYIKVAAAGTEVLEGEGELFAMEFLVDDGVTADTTALLDFQEMKFNDPGDDDSPTALTHNGEIIITGLEPTIPELQKPAHEATGIELMPEFSWQVDFGDLFDIRIAADEDFNNLVTEAVETDETTFTLNDSLAYGTTYWWKVRSHRNDRISDWSEPQKFTTKAEPPDAPELATPGNGAEDVEIPAELEWFEIAEADSYRVQVSAEDSFNDTVVDSSGITDTLLTVSALQEDTEYHWRVKSYDSGVSGDWSETWMFETGLEAPGIVELYAPEDEADGIELPLELEWFKADPAESYNLQLSEDNNFNALVIDSIGISDTTLTVNPELEDSKTYYWRVQSERQSIVSEWSEVFLFETAEAVSSEQVSDIPEEFGLHQNYPNPFNPVTTIRYAIPEETEVTLEVYNTLGERIAVLVNGRQSPGEYEVNFDGSGFSSGLFIYHLQSGDVSLTRQMTLIK